MTIGHENTLLWRESKLLASCFTTNKQTSKSVIQLISSARLNMGLDFPILLRLPAFMYEQQGAFRCQNKELCFSHDLFENSGASWGIFLRPRRILIFSSFALRSISSPCFSILIRFSFVNCRMLRMFQASLFVRDPQNIELLQRVG